MFDHYTRTLISKNNFEEKLKTHLYHNFIYICPNCGWEKNINAKCCVNCNSENKKHSGLFHRKEKNN